MTAAQHETGDHTTGDGAFVLGETTRRAWSHPLRGRVVVARATPPRSLTPPPSPPRRAAARPTMNAPSAGQFQERPTPVPGTSNGGCVGKGAPSPERATPTAGNGEKIPRVHGETAPPPMGVPTAREATHGVGWVATDTMGGGLFPHVPSNPTVFHRYLRSHKSSTPSFKTPNEQHGGHARYPPWGWRAWRCCGGKASRSLGRWDIRIDE